MAKNVSKWNRPAGPLVPVFWAVLTFLVLAAGVVLVWTRLDQQERQSLANVLQAELRLVTTQVEGDLRQRLVALKRFAAIWQRHSHQQAFPSQVFLDYQTDLPGLQALEFVTPAGRVEWALPAEGNRQAIGLDLSFEDNRRQAMAASRKSGQPAVSRAIDLVQGGKGFLVFTPLLSSQGFHGWLLAVFRAEDWLKFALNLPKAQAALAETVVTISLEDIPLLVWGETETAVPDSSARAEARFLGRSFPVTVQAQKVLAERLVTWGPPLSLGVGLASALVVALALLLFLRLQSHRQEKLLVKKELEQSEFRVGEILQTIAEERRRLTYILEGTNVGTWEWRVQTGGVTFNDRWAEFIGYTLAELEPVSIKTWEQLTHPDDLAKSGRLLEAHFRGELDYYECEVRMRHRDGHWVWVLDRGRVATWGEDGKPVLMAGTHQDISERKLLEAERERLIGELKAGNDAKDRFFRIIAHDVRGPLMALLQVTELQLHDPELPPETLQPMLLASRDTLRGLEYLLDNILDWSLSQIGALKVRLETVNLTQLVQRVLDLARVGAETKGVTVQTSLDLVQGYRTDPKFLTTILRNLLGNAVKFTPAGGVVRLTVRQQGSGVVISIKDDGIGISAEVQSRLFQPGQLPGSYGTAGEKGTGLGLLLCRELTQHLGGELRLESQEGEGTEVTLDLP